MQLFTQYVSMLHAEKAVLRYYVWFSQIRSHMVRQVLQDVLLVVIFVQGRLAAANKRPWQYTPALLQLEA